MFGCISSAISGLVCGFIARFLLFGNDSMGWTKTMLVGVIGAYVGTALGRATGRLQANAQAGWIWSILGSMAVLIGLRFLS